MEKALLWSAYAQDDRFDGLSQKLINFLDFVSLAVVDVYLY